MTSKDLLEGIKANYPTSTHPTELGERDFIRSVRSFGFIDSQLDKLYDELLATCDFFPKVHDLYRCVKKLGLERIEQNQVNQTRKMLDEQADSYTGGITFNQWLYSGGYEEIVQDCHGNMKKVRARLNLMGVTSLPERVRPKEPQRMEFLTEDLPVFDFPSSSIEDL